MLGEPAARGDRQREQHEQEARERQLAGASGAEAIAEIQKYLRKTELWRFRFEPEMSYPRAAAR